jgi:hypothetical protein
VRLYGSELTYSATRLLYVLSVNGRERGFLYVLSVNGRERGLEYASGGGTVSINTAVSDGRRGSRARQDAMAPAVWTSHYRRAAAGADFVSALAAGSLAFEVRFDSQGSQPAEYLALSALLPVLWIASVALAGGYDPRFIGLGSDEFRKILNAAVSLTAGIAIASYAVRFDVARGYVVLALPTLAAFDLTGRYLLRRRLHKRRRRGRYMRRTVVAGHKPAVTDLVTQLRRDSHHGLSVVAVCVAGPRTEDEVAGVPVAGGLDSVATTVAEVRADTVAVLACPEMNGRRLRELAWNLEKSNTDMCVASALLDVAGPRTTIRPVAGLPLLHVDHPELAGLRQVVKGVFDRVLAALVLILLAPLFAAIALTIKLVDPGPVFFQQPGWAGTGKPSGCGSSAPWWWTRKPARLS